MPDNPQPDEGLPLTGPDPVTRPDPDAPHATPAPGAESSAIILAPGGRLLPEYELVRLLGRGGFGEVWQAKGPGGFDVALKFIRMGERAGQVELRALELMKGIRHAHLLPMFGAWERAGLLIVAMELADRTLADRLSDVQAQGAAGIPMPEMLEYLREASKGLDYLNEHHHPSGTGEMVGIQHKDVKPQNLLLVGGTVKVADFGLARLLEHTVITASGCLTPAYAPPEFFRGQATRWSDQYSLAVTYCQLRGGRLPFDGDMAQMMAGHLMDAPDLGMLPVAERPAVARALAKKPEDRWPSCRAFAEALPGGTAPAEIIGAAPVAAPTGRSGRALTNSLGMQFAWCVPGTFLMGSPTNEDDRGDDEHQHPVTLSRGFYLGAHPVTQAQWLAVMGSNPSKFKGEDRPVESVSWDECQEFCRKLSARDGQRYRLPTEAEWEYACRASTITPFSFGKTISTDVANYDGTYSYGRGKKGVYRQQTTPVGSFPPNAWGLYDMHGNVWEWCQDGYAPYPNCTIKDYQTKDKAARVLRGGSWYDAPRFCRSAARFRYAPTVHNDDVGFRVLLVTSP
jgi:formylglycine-generating enzyme required for sulfatase activity